MFPGIKNVSIGASFGVCDSQAVLHNTKISCHSTSRYFIIFLLAYHQDVELGLLKVEGKSNYSAGVFLPIKYGDSTLKVQTPPLRAPFGITSFSNEGDQNRKSSFRLPLSMDDFKTDDKMISFRRFIIDLENEVIKKAQASGKEWFSKDPRSEIIKFQFKSSMREAPDGNYDPTLTLKIPVRNGIPSVEIFEGREEAPFESIQKNSQMSAIIEPSIIWIVGDAWGISWNALQLRLERK